MYPDGGISRFRLFVNVVPVWPADVDAIAGLGHVANGGIAVASSGEHFGTTWNLLLPGRGLHMGDVWETKRNRGGDHVDWVIFKLVSYPGISESREREMRLIGYRDTPVTSKRSLLARSKNFPQARHLECG